MSDTQNLPKLRAGDWAGVNRNFKKLFSSLRLGPDAIPTFASIVLTTLTPSRLMFDDADKALDSVENLQDWIAGTANQVITADDGDGSITLSTPQNIHTGASPTFVDMTLTAFDATETISEILVDTINAGVLDAITISDDGGRAISWTAGKVYTPAGNIVITSSGSGTCTDNATNYLIWTSGTTLTLQTTKPTSAEIPIAHISVAANDLWEIHEESLLDVVVYNMHHGMAESVPLFVASGLATSEDTDATNPLDVVTAAGKYYHDMHEEHVVTEKKSRTTPMRRWFHSSSVWTNDTNTQIDNTQYDNGTDLTAVLTSKYYRSTFLISETEIHWIYPQESFNTLNAALLGSDPTIPTGLDAFPKTVTVIMKQGDTAFPTAGGDRWIDRRPLFGTGGSSSGSVADHGSLSGLTDDDHAQYLLVDGTRAMSGDLDMGNNNIVNPGTGHDIFTDFVGNEHIDHTTVSVSSGGILSGGGTIAATRTISLAQADVDHNSITNTHNLTSDIDHGNLTGTGDDDHTQYLLVAGTRAMSGDLDMGTSSITADSDLKILPDATGNVDFFGDTDVGDAADGKTLFIHRKAAEGDTFIQIGINQFQSASIQSSAAFTLYGTGAFYFSSDGLMNIQYNANNDVSVFGNSAEGETQFLQIVGYPTGGSKDWCQMGFDSSVTGKFNFTGANDSYTFDKTVRLKEIATAVTNSAGFGQLWVKNDGPNILMFTDDAGTDFTVDVTPV